MRSQNRWWATSIAAFSLILCAGSVHAEDKAKDKDKDKEKPGMAAVGTIVSVADDLSQFELQVGKGEQSKTLNITVTDETVYEIDGEAATAEQVLVVDARVKVRHEDAVASKVSVWPKHEQKDKDKDADDDDAADDDDSAHNGDHAGHADAHEGHGKDKDKGKDNGEDDDAEDGQDGEY